MSGTTPIAKTTLPFGTSRNERIDDTTTIIVGEGICVVNTVFGSSNLICKKKDNTIRMFIDY